MPEDSSFNPNNLSPEPDDHELDPSGEDAIGNRPAEGAPQATPGDVLTGSFQGSANAGDFLGLDVEVGGYAAAAPLADAGEQESDTGPALESVEKAVATDLMDEPVYDEEGYDEPVYDEEGFGEADEAFADPGLEDPFESDEPTATPRKSMGLFVAGAFIIGLLVVAGIVLGPRYPELMERFGLKGTEVATNAPTPSSTTTAGTATDPTAATPEGVDPAVDPTSDPTGVDPAGAVVEADPNTVTDDPNGALLDPWLGDSSGGELGAIEDIDEVWGTPETTVGPDVAQADVLPLDTGQGIFLPEALTTSLDWATADQLDMIWRDTTIPLEAIGAPARLLTPRVGAVRVHMTSGEMFEGRLYALGQGQVWVDAAPGRIGLDGERVARFERLAPEQVIANTSIIATATGERVRVRVPGGLIYGRVVSQTGDQVTLITDDGGRVALENAVVESMGSRRAIVVER